jgi:DNA-binding NtrC family response regulator
MDQEHTVVVKNIGLDGAFLQLEDSSWLDSLTDSLECSFFLPEVGDLKISADLVRKDKRGAAIHFSKISPKDRSKIWAYLSGSLSRGKECPYCNRPRDLRKEHCVSCNWRLDFNKQDYLNYWEREKLYRTLNNKLSELDIDDLRRVSQFFSREFELERGRPPTEETTEFVGTCEAMKEVFSLIRKFAPTDLPVLIQGESGTGKELTARAIHERSPRADQPFVPVNCAAIPESLIEAELFGYEKGAFTGATTAKKGKFEYADKGTLFLDEIGEFPLSLQPKLLRFLETQAIERIGALKARQVDVRILSATNKDLEKETESGRFRRDLYHRIKVLSIKLPPLRERGEDMVILARYLFKKVKMERDWPCRGFSKEALNAIRSYSWPGNVRELINRVRRAMVVQDEWIRPEDMELFPSASEPRYDLKRAKDQIKDSVIRSSLRAHDYNITATARSLGISRQYLHALIKKMGIPTSKNTLA